MKQEYGIRYFPIALFASVMGFSGVTIAIKNAETLLGWNNILSLIFLIISTLLFLFNGGILVYRLIRYRDLVKQDFNHPVKMNFFPAISISLLLLAVSYFDINQNLSFIIWALGAILQLVLALLILTKKMWKTSFEIVQFNPTWFIPIVGNIVVPLAGVFHVGSDINWFFFGAGVIFSIIYLTIFFNRIFFHPALPKMLIPTLFILMAPPAIGFMSYLKLAGQVDAFAYILYGIAFFIGLLLLFQWKLFIKVPFFVSWWAFLFPSAAMTIATVQMHLATEGLFYKWLFLVQMIGLILLVIYLTWRTIQLATSRKLCLKG